MAFRHALFALLPLPRIYRRRVWHPCHTHAALQGVQRSPLHQPSTRAPTLQSSHGIHGTHRNFWRRRASHRFHRCPQMVRLRRVLPWNSRNSQKLLAEKSLPQMCTDAHRWLGCVGFSHGIHGIHRSFWRRRASHRCHRCPQMVRLRRVLPRNSRNTQKLLAEKSLPQISQISQMVRLRRVLWEDSFVVAWVWQGCHTLL